MTNRRAVVCALACIVVAAPRIARGQRTGGKHRIGYLHPTTAQEVGYTAMRRALEQLGYVPRGVRLQVVEVSY